LSEAKKVISCTLKSSVIYELAKIVPNRSYHVWVQHMITNALRLFIIISFYTMTMKFLTFFPHKN